MKRRFLIRLLCLGILLVLLPSPEPACDEWWEEPTLEIFSQKGMFIPIPPLTEGKVTSMTVPLSAVFDDGTGRKRDVTEEAVWTIDSTDWPGISFDGKGTFTVTTEAASEAPGEIEMVTYSVKAAYGNLTSELYNIRFYKEWSDAVKVEIRDPVKNIAIPKAGEDPNTVDYTAILCDQYGAAIPDSWIEWKLSPWDAGVELYDAEYGKASITVSSTATAGEYALTASYYDGINSLTAEISIEIGALPPHKLTFPANTLRLQYGKQPASLEAVHAPDCGCSGQGKIAYSSSDERIAAVDAATGRLTLKGAGTAVITAAIEGDSVRSAASASYTVTVAALDLSHADIAPIPDMTYTGSRITPIPKVTAWGQALTAGQDYIVTYANNFNVGTALVTVTAKAGGGCTGSKEAAFFIRKAIPAISGIFIKSTVFETTKLADISISGSATNGGWGVGGTFSITEGQTLVPWISVYYWTFTPAEPNNYETVQGTVSIEVHPRMVTELTVSGQLLRQDYVYGDLFDPAGLTLTAAYNDGGTETVTNQAVFNGGRPLAVGQTNVTVSYGGKKIAIPISAVQRRDIVFQPQWSPSEDFVFDGETKTITVTNLPEGVQAAYRSHTGAGAGAYTAEAVFSLAKGYSSDNYRLVIGQEEGTVSRHDWSIRKAAGCSFTFTVPVETGTAKTVDLSGYLPADCGTLTAELQWDDPKVLLAGPPVWDDTGKLTLSLKDSAGKDDTAAVTLRVGTQNYEDILFTITAAAVGPDLPVLSVSPLTRTYNGKAVSPEELTKSAVFQGETVAGTWSFTGESPVNAADSGVYWLLFTPADTKAYAAASISTVITITRAQSIGEPHYEPVSAPGKTLADAHLTAGSLSPSAGSLCWDLDEATPVMQGHAYGWTFTPEDPNYSIRTDSIILWPNGPEPDNPEPDNPEPDTPEPDNPGPDNPEPDNPEPDTPGPDNPEPDNPEPDNPEPDNPEPDNPEPDKPEPDNPEPDNPEPDNPEPDDPKPDNPHSGGGHHTGSGTHTVAVPVETNENVIEIIIPVDNRAPGIAALLLDENGNSRVLRKSVINADGVMVIPLSGSAVVEIRNNSKHFDDVSAGDWYHDAVDFVSARELIQGVAPACFAPDTPITRGMLAVVLHNLEDNPQSAVPTAFTDVAPDAWYAQGVSWAAENGLVSGFGDGRFAPEQSLSRQDLAVMFWNYAGRPAKPADLHSFRDAGAVSPYARAAMAWAVSSGIIHGRDFGLLDPLGTATRAEAAQMLWNFMTLNG